MSYMISTCGSLNITVLAASMIHFTCRLLFQILCIVGEVVVFLSLLFRLGVGWVGNLTPFLVGVQRRLCNLSGLKTIYPPPSPPCHIVVFELLWSDECSTGIFI